MTAPVAAHLDDYAAVRRVQNSLTAFTRHFIKVNELGQPLELTPFQERVLDIAFRLGPDGRFENQTILWSQPKKSGKTAINSLGVVWWAFTQEAPNEILVVANDLEQAQGRVFSDAVELIRRNNFYIHPRTGKRLPGGLAAGVEKILSREIVLKNGTVMRAISSEYTSEAGGNLGLTSWDELWAYVSERSVRLYEELTPVPTRLNSVRLITSYAGFEGESSVLRRLYLSGVGSDEHQEGQGQRIQGAEGLPVWRNSSARLFVLWDHEHRMSWQTEEYYEEQRNTLRPSSFVRLHENRWTTSETVFLNAVLWDACVDTEWKPLLRSDQPTYVGVDAATKRDSAAVVAVQWDGDRLAVVSHRIWRPTQEEPLDIEATIQEHLLDLAARFQVDRILGDPWQLHQMITGLAAQGIPIEEYPQTVGNTTAMGQALWDLISGRNLKVYPAEDLKTQALGTAAVETPRGWRIAKEKASRKIDSMVALAMACVAALNVRGSPSRVGATTLVDQGRAATRTHGSGGWLGALKTVRAMGARRGRSEEEDPRCR